MKAEWAIWRGAFSPDECESILRRSDNLPTFQANQGLNGENPDLRYRRSKLKWMKEDIYRDVFDKMWRMTIQTNEQFFGFQINNLEFMQLGEYHSRDRGEYKRHHDVFWLNGSPKHRKLSVVLQLTDPSKYEGGQLSIDVQNEQPKDYFGQGTVIWFPSFLEHWVTPVTKGVRHSVVCWFEGPDWR